MFIPGENPYAMLRLTQDEVELLRRNVALGGGMAIDQFLAPLSPARCRRPTRRR
ncbi:MAG: hypothetical protein PGN25_14745 [Methylorubrum populi]